MGCGKTKEVSNPNVEKKDVQPSTTQPASRKQAEAIFFLGGPGSGKGTQCARLAGTGKWVHLSTGDLLREEAKTGSKHAQMIASYQSEGKMVPSELLVDLVRAAMEKTGWSTKRYLIDGYPRNAENVEVWKRKMPDVKILCLMFLECREEILMQRILSRNQGRSDDNEEAMKKRLRVFEDQTRPVLEIVKKDGIRVEMINGEVSTDEVYQQIVSKLPQT